MNIIEINNLINDLIDLSNAKYCSLKVGQDTLHNDLLFIKKFEELKEKLAVKTLNDIDLKELPKIKELQNIINDINKYEIEKNNRNVRLNRASNAYKNNKR